MVCERCGCLQAESNDYGIAEPGFFLTHKVVTKSQTISTSAAFILAILC